MQIPIASTITLIMELIIGFLIYFIVFQGYKNNKFSSKLAFFAISYEIVFNVGYMVYRTVVKPSTAQLGGALKGVAAAHGILSLIMLIAVVALFLKASKEYAKNTNYFAAHRMQTCLFVLLWSISLLSGIFLYAKVYLF
ncbi:hypothetical protein HGA34_02795 [Candidatus Falkowbacteria bacterium]|nr:hypothetical protein [Candidatus Falkowbacteria bacterium]